MTSRAAAAFGGARVDLWTWRLDQPDEAVLWPLLSDDEKARADRYVFPVDRTQFIAARGRLRQILGERAGADPVSLAFDKGEHGKPSLAGRADVRFNFSDSGVLGCLAIAEGEGGPLGVDIEAMRPRDYLKMSERYFSPSEHAVLASLEPAQQAPAFFRGWTRKEAFLKAVGTGLSTRLDAFEVTLGHGQAARMMRIDASYFPGVDADAGAWALAHLSPAPDYMGAIALQTGGAPIEIVVRETLR